MHRADGDTGRSANRERQDREERTGLQRLQMSCDSSRAAGEVDQRGCVATHPRERTSSTARWGPPRRREPRTGGDHRHMPIFLILGLEELLEAAIPERFADGHWMHACGADGYLVRTEVQTAEELKEQVGISQTAPGLIIRLDDYSGVLDEGVAARVNKWRAGNSSPAPDSAAASARRTNAKRLRLVEGHQPETQGRKK